SPRHLTPTSSPLPYTTLFRSNVVWKNISIVDLDPNNIAPPGGGWDDIKIKPGANILVGDATGEGGTYDLEFTVPDHIQGNAVTEDRKSTRLNSSHVKISYTVL